MCTYWYVWVNWRSRNYTEGVLHMLLNASEMMLSGWTQAMDQQNTLLVWFCSLLGVLAHPMTNKQWHTYISGLFLYDKSPTLCSVLSLQCSKRCECVWWMLFYSAYSKTIREMRKWNKTGSQLIKHKSNNNIWICWILYIWIINYSTNYKIKTYRRQ